MDEERFLAGLGGIIGRLLPFTNEHHGLVGGRFMACVYSVDGGGGSVSDRKERFANPSDLASKRGAGVIAHFCAVCPRNNSSAGKTITSGLIKAGDDLLRQVLVEAAHRLIRYNPEWKVMADRLRANGKKTCVTALA